MLLLLLLPPSPVLQTPKFLQYPVSKEAHNIAQAGVSLIYGPSWVESIKSLVRMVQHIMKA